MFGKTVFVHGGVCVNSLGYVPGIHCQKRLTAEEWIENLNQWAKRELRDSLEYAEWQLGNPPNDKNVFNVHTGIDSHTLWRGGQWLMDYATVGDRSVIYNSHTPNSEPSIPSREVKRIYFFL